MFSLAYVLLPFSGRPPADAIRESLAPFQRGTRGDLPDDWLTFDDETGALRTAHETCFTFTDQGTHGLRIQGDAESVWYLDSGRLRDEMRRRGQACWTVRFADEMDLNSFHKRFCHGIEHDAPTGRFGMWRNPLGRWDWWDLGGRFDGAIVDDPARGQGRTVAHISSGMNPGRALLANLEDAVGEALGQAPFSSVDVLSNRNIEMVATLLADACAGRDNAYPGTIVLPPGAVEDRLRWLDTWPEPGPAEAFAWLGLPPEPAWPAVVSAAYARFEDHWAAGVAYHH